MSVPVTTTPTVTRRDLPLASVTPIRSADLRVRAGARARIAATVRDAKVGRIVAGLVGLVRADLLAWWLLTNHPGTLYAWWAMPQPLTVPQGKRALRVAATVDKWTFGLLCALASAALFLAAGGLRWLAGHPVRRWTALAVTAAGVAAGLISTYAH